MTLMSSDTESSISKTMGMALFEFAEHFGNSAYDAIILLGDRYETLACIGLTTEVRVADLSKDSFFQLPRFDCDDFSPKSNNYNNWIEE